MASKNGGQCAPVIDMDPNEAVFESAKSITLPSILIECFSRLEELCCRTNMPSAAELLCKVRHMLDMELSKRQGSNNRWKLLTEMRDKCSAMNALLF